MGFRVNEVNFGTIRWTELRKDAGRFAAEDACRMMTLMEEVEPEWRWQMWGGGRNGWMVSASHPAASTRWMLELPEAARARLGRDRGEDAS